MYCVSCGKSNSDTAQFCQSCGHSTNGSAPPKQNADGRISKDLATYISGVMSSDTWLNIWSKGILPLHGVFGLILAVIIFSGTNFDNASDEVIRVRWSSFGIGGISILAFFVAAGLKKKEIWAWNTNWAALVIIGIELTALFSSGILVSISIFAAWIIANKFYWADKRKHFK